MPLGNLVFPEGYRPSDSNTSLPEGGLGQLVEEAQIITWDKLKNIYPIVDVNWYINRGVTPDFAYQKLLSGKRPMSTPPDYSITANKNIPSDIQDSFWSGTEESLNEPKTQSLIQTIAELYGISTDQATQIVNNMLGLNEQTNDSQNINVNIPEINIPDFPDIPDYTQIISDALNRDSDGQQNSNELFANTIDDVISRLTDKTPEPVEQAFISPENLTINQQIELSPIAMLAFKTRSKKLWGLQKLPLNQIIEIYQFDYDQLFNKAMSTNERGNYYGKSKRNLQRPKRRSEVPQFRQTRKRRRPYQPQSYF